jgi:hypothetical protein
VSDSTTIQKVNEFKATDPRTREDVVAMHELEGFRTRVEAILRFPRR